jgi:ABC-type branched-subunit amino acid transport system substrate-binding protein
VADAVEKSHTPVVGYGINVGMFVNNPWAFGITGNYAAGTYSATGAFIQLAQSLHKKPAQIKLAMISYDGVSGANTLKVAKPAAVAVGYKVVYDAGNIPLSGTTNYAPYAQDIIQSGANAVYTGLGISDVVGLMAALKQAGSSIPVENGETYLPGELASQPSEEAALQGAYVYDEWPAAENDTPATRQEEKDLKAIGQPPNLTTGVSTGYWSGEMLISMLQATEKRVGSAAKVTPTALKQTVNAGYTFHSAKPGGMGAVSFPEGLKKPNSCSTMLFIKGTKFIPTASYQCVGTVVPVPQS